jgi:hypothetical protein
MSNSRNSILRAENLAALVWFTASTSRGSWVLSHRNTTGKGALENLREANQAF